MCLKPFDRDSPVNKSHIAKSYLRYKLTFDTSLKNACLVLLLRWIRTPFIGQITNMESKEYGSKIKILHLSSELLNEQHTIIQAPT